MNIIKITTIVSLSLISLNTFACDSFSYYDKQTKEISIALSGDPSLCNSKMEIIYLEDEIIEKCEDISRITKDYQISETEAKNACNKIKEESRAMDSDEFLEIF